MKNLWFLYLALMSVTLMGCASQGTSVSESSPSCEIIDITIDENPESLILSVRGNQNLAHQAVSQTDPRTVKLLFPATDLNGIRGRYIPPENEIIGTIKASKRVQDDTTNSIIFVALKFDATYAVAPERNELRVTFPKNPASPDKTKPIVNPEEKTIEKQPKPPLVETVAKSVPAATALQTVTTSFQNNKVAVNVVADGIIKNYNTFTLVEPDRIVFDLFQVKSPQVKEQKIAVQSEWIKRIRYFGHPDKLRLVIETNPINLPTYSSTSTNTGLTIKVGESD